MPVESFNIEPSKLTPEQEAALDAELANVMAVYQGE
jgi:hypothetical protein